MLDTASQRYMQHHAALMKKRRMGHAMDIDIRQGGAYVHSGDL